MDGERLGSIDRHLVWLSRSNGRMRLRVGEALDAFFRLMGHHGCGFSTVAAYSAERLGRTVGWVKETRKVAVRLRRLPLLRAAFERGELGWSKAELLTRHATAQGEDGDENEAEMVRLGRTCTVRQLRKRFGGGRPDEELSEEAQQATLSLSLSPEEDWLFEATRIVVDHHAGGCRRGRTSNGCWPRPSPR